jgi:raffinose/stachyose/melibiose transport system permease protein
MNFRRKNNRKAEITQYSYGIDKKRDLGVFVSSRIIMAITIIVILFPILYILSISLRTQDTIYKDFLYLIPRAVTFQNYIDAFNYARDHLDVSFLEMFRNSIICTSVSIFVAIVIAALASYSFSHFKFRGKEVSFTLIIASFVIPAQVLLIPLFFILRNLKILNTYFAIIIPYIGFLIPIATLILRSFFEQIPMEIKESAKIDGATDFGVFVKIVLPLSKSAIATCVILLFLETWNEFIFALVFLQNPKIQTIPVAIAKIAGSKYLIPLGTYGASIIITVIPVLVIFIIFQRWFIAGITMGSVKG